MYSKQYQKKSSLSRLSSFLFKWKGKQLQGSTVNKRKKDSDILKLYPKPYTWHIPKHLRDVNLQPGDIVYVEPNKNTKALSTLNIPLTTISNSLVVLTSVISIFSWILSISSK